MQFVKNGPDIPEPLLQEHEDGRVVFFCGAGISYPARLPGFQGLVESLYSALGQAPSQIERAAIKSKQYDTAIGLLEGRIVGGRAIVREQLARILTPDISAPRATATHEALLTLARNRQHRYRLITTNFDRLFAEVTIRLDLKMKTFEAPRLPLPRNRWDGLVYLHGLLQVTPTTEELDDLVVSSGDFGRAYLTDRWAARFVSELFRNYTVCFVGYSINDPVLRYMMDALAADRLLGESPIEMFAFGSYSKGKADERANEWRAKNVTPILYREHNRHALLHRTLRAWADVYRDGVSGKERIISQYATHKPLASTKEDDFVGRVLWAMSDQRALPAKRFAQLEPVPPLDWLEPLAETRFRHIDLVRFGVRPDTKVDDKLAFSLVSRPTPYTRAPWMMLMCQPQIAGQWDDVMVQLACWLIRHLNDPKLILWVAKHGGRLHPLAADAIARALREDRPSAQMQTLWGLVLSGRLQSSAAQLDLHDWRTRFNRDGLTATLRVQLRELLSPRVRLSEPFRWGEDQGQVITEGPTRIKELVDWEIVLCTGHVHWTLKNLKEEPRWNESLPELLFDATVLLHDTLDLMRELGAVDERHDMSYAYQPSIIAHPQNQDFRDWTALIDLARDAWQATADRFPQRARIEAERWLATPYPLFKRLAFFAATNTSLFTPSQALSWLLSDDDWWLWSPETEREALRLLVAVAPQLNAHDREHLEGAILKGPPRAMFSDDIEPDRLQSHFDRRIWLRLAKYRAARGQIGIDAAARLNAVSQQYPELRLAEDQRDEFRVWMGDGEELRKFTVMPKHRRDLVTWLRENQNSNHWDEDDWRERCKRDFPTTACTLVSLAQSGEWFTGRWHQALQAWSDEKLTARSWRYMGVVLAMAPDEVLKELAHSLSWWLRAVAKTFGRNEADFLSLIRRILLLHREEGIEDDDPVSRAINSPVGQVTEAALRWWYRRDPRDGEGLIEILKPIFTDICDREVVSFRHGRLLLATHVIALFRVDRAWTARFLLPLFDWARSREEARAAWEGFLWSPRLYRPLMEAIKSSFLATAQHYAELGEYGKQYAAFLTFAALDSGDTFSKAELVDATRSLPEEGLQRAAQALGQALESGGEQRAEYWRNRVLPYLKTIWPRSRQVITPGISESLARLCIAAQEMFPEALRELKHWLRPPEYPDYLMYLLHEGSLCTRFPAEALTFLDAVIDDSAQRPTPSLKDCLGAIRDAQPALEADDRFVRLHEYLRRYDLA